MRRAVVPVLAAALALVGCKVGPNFTPLDVVSPAHWVEGTWY